MKYISDSASEALHYGTINLCIIIFIIIIIIVYYYYYYYYYYFV